MKRSTVTKLLAVLAVFLGLGMMVSVFALIGGGMAVRWIQLPEEQIASIEVRNGCTGETFTLDTPEEICAVAELSSQFGPHIGVLTTVLNSGGGYNYAVTARNASGETIEQFTAVDTDLLSMDGYHFSANLTKLITYLESVDPSL